MEMQIKITLPHTRVTGADLFDMLAADAAISADIAESTGSQIGFTVDQDEEATFVIVHQNFSGYTHENTTDIARVALTVRARIKGMSL